MRFFGHLVAMLMCLALAGGTQACAYLCGPAAHATTTDAAKPTCHHCGDKAKSKPTSAPEPPCQNCDPTAKDKLADTAVDPVKAPTQLVALLPVLDITPSFASVRPAVGVHADVGRPPNDRLHQFCLLLI
jgi:hypothetical protein